MMHAMSAPRELRDTVVAGADAYAEQLVDFVLGLGGGLERCALKADTLAGLVARTP